MSKLAKTRLLKYGITSAACLAVTVYTAYNRGFLEATTMEDKWRILSDAFYLPGILLVLVGLLIWLSQEGALLGISYVFKSLVRLVIPFRRHESYADYRARHEEKDKGGFGFLIIVGLIFFAIGIVFVFLHMGARGEI